MVADAGCEIYEPNDVELKAFQDAVQPVYDQCVSEGNCTAEEIAEMHKIVAGA